MKDKRKTKNKKRSSRVFTQKNKKKGRGLFKKIFKKDLHENLISKTNKNQNEYSEMSYRELIETIEMLLQEANKVEILEQEIDIYKNLFNKDDITSLIAALTDAMHFQSRIGNKESVKIKQEYHDLMRKLNRLLENI